MAEQQENQTRSSNKVFISYSRADRHRAEGLAELLESLGNEVFFDKRSIKGGRMWEKEIYSKIEESDILVVFWTKNAAKSEWVRREYKAFGSSFTDRPIVPVLGDNTPLSPAQRY